jgi:2-deoxy-D-gluconate 3-dehydrogenase
MALALAKAGADIVLLQVRFLWCIRDMLLSNSTFVKRNPENNDTSSQIEQLGRRAVIVQCNLGSKEQVGSIIQKITGNKEENGLGLVIDILVNCGGIQRRLVLLNRSRIPLIEFRSSLSAEALRKIFPMLTGTM